MAEDDRDPADLSYIRDLGEIVRARNLFFIPFYGAFLAFILTQSSYIINASIVVQILSGATFLVGAYYAAIVSRYLWMLEMFRFLHGTNSKYKHLDEDGAKALKALGSAALSNMKWEGRVFKWEMNLLWLTTGTVLIDIYFGKFLNSVTAKILYQLIKHFTTN
jgi:hypothetical protein